MGTLKPNIAHDLGLSDVQISWVFSIFSWSYALFGIPGGVMADRFGTRTVLTLIVVGWSLCTILTGQAVGFWNLMVVRFIFGAAEAGAWPSVARTFAQWLPKSERARAQGTFFAGSHFAAGVTAYLVADLLRMVSWREVFFAFGIVGLAWAIVWAIWFRNLPSEHPSVDAAECALIGEPIAGLPKVEWLTLLRMFTRSKVWILCGMYFPLSTFFYFCITWLPTYLKEQLGLRPQLATFFAALPLVLCAFADVLGGWATDQAVTRRGLRDGYRVVGAGAFAVSAVTLIAAPLTSNGIVAGLLISVGTGASMFTLPAAWGASTKIGGPQAATVSAAMNTAGQIGSAICPLLVGYALKWFHSWTLSIEIMAGFFVIGALCWLKLEVE
jgi:MFS family permease